MEFCPHCMRPATGETCPNCGGLIQWTAALGQLPLGTLLRGANGHTYQIGAARGQGGFGITYAAMDLNNAQRVAIKEFYPTRCAMRTQLNQVAPMTGQDDAYRGGMKSFLEEAMMLSAVGALPSVVSVKDYFEANGTAYLVMEFVDGVPLHQIVTQRGKMAAKELLPKLPELLADLDTLHKAGVIHRDISPDNIILMPDGKLKLLDFGSARSIQDGKSMTVLLKAGFSPVEQYQSRGQGPWTDVYALASTIYYCLTGVIPPSAADRLDEDHLQKPNTLGAGLTQEQEDALLWALVVQPKSRPASVYLFRQRLFPPEKNDDQQQFVSDDRKDDNTDSKTEEKNKKSPVDDHTVHTKQDPEVEKPSDSSHGQNQSTVSYHDTADDPAAQDAQSQTDTDSPPPSQPKWKKLIPVGIVGLLAIVLIIVGISFFSNQDSDDDLPSVPEIEQMVLFGNTSDGFAYQLNMGSHATITKYNGDGGTVIIPKTIEGLQVTNISSKAFENRGDVMSLVISSDVRPAVGAFAGCDGITTVVFKEGIPSMDVWQSALRDCENLRCICFASQEMYDACTAEQDLSEMESVVSCYVGQDTGYGILQSVEVSNGIAYALTDTKNAVIFLLPEGVDGDSLSPTYGSYQVILPDGRFPGQPEPVSGETADGFLYTINADRTDCVITGYKGTADVISFPEMIEDVPVTRIGEKAFAGNSAITAAYFPLQLTQIMTDAFKDCVNLKEIHLYSNCATLPTAFTGCKALSTVVFKGDNSSVMGWASALRGCDALRCVLFHSKASYELCVDKQYFKDFKTVSLCYVGQDTGHGKIQSVMVSDGVAYALTDENNAVVLRLPEGVTGDSLPKKLDDHKVILPDGRTPGQSAPSNQTPTPPSNPPASNNNPPAPNNPPASGHEKPENLTSGQTDDGFQYTITADKKTCAITGYTGSKAVVSIPETIDGVSVTVLDKNAFAGNTNLKSVFFPKNLTEIRSGAFANCSSLRDIYVYSNCTAQSDAFSGCDKLRCAVRSSSSVSMDNWTLPSELKVYDVGMDTGVGKLKYVDVCDQGVIYGITAKDKAVVMDVPDSTTELSIKETVDGYPVEWVYKNALGGVSKDAVIKLPPNALIHSSLVNAVDWEFLDADKQYTLAECWWYTCYLSSSVNNKRGTPTISPDLNLVRAAMVRAEELKKSDSHTRPNGKDWDSVLGEYGIDWKYGFTSKEKYDGDATSKFVDDIKALTEDFSQPEEAYHNEYYTKVAVGLYYDSAKNATYFICLAIIQ